MTHTCTFILLYLWGHSIYYNHSLSPNLDLNPHNGLDNLNQQPFVKERKRSSLLRFLHIFWGYFACSKTHTQDMNVLGWFVNLLSVIIVCIFQLSRQPWSQPTSIPAQHSYWSWAVAPAPPGSHTSSLPAALRTHTITQAFSRVSESRLQSSSRPWADQRLHPRIHQCGLQG